MDSSTTTAEDNKNIWQTSVWEGKNLSPAKTSLFEYKTIAATLAKFKDFTFGDFSGGYGLFGLVVKQDFSDCDVAIINNNPKEIMQCENLRRKLHISVDMIKKAPQHVDDVFDITLHDMPTLVMLNGNSPEQVASLISKQTAHTVIIEIPSFINDPVAQKLLGDKITLINDLFSCLFKEFRITDCHPLIGTNKRCKIIRMCYVLDKRF